MYAHSVNGVECATEVRAAELFFFLIQQEPATTPGSETFSPFLNDDIRTHLFSADVLKKCALIALHVIEAFNSFIGDGFQVQELKGESQSSDAYQTGNVNNEALHVIGLHGSGDKISLFLQDWGVGTGGIKLSHGHGHLVPGMYEVERRRGWFGF